MREAQQDDLALALGERVKSALQHRTLLGGLEAGLGRSERVGRGPLVVVGLGRVERRGAVVAAGVHRLEDQLLAGAERLCELHDRRAAPELGAEARAGAPDLRVQLLELARDAHSPRAVAEVALDLAGDVRRGERRQPQAAVEVEAVDRIDEADRADLDQVVERLAAAGVADRDAAHEGQQALDQFGARRFVTFEVPALEQCTLGRRRHVRGAVASCARGTSGSGVSEGL